jgi:hypothetical protein
MVARFIAQCLHAHWQRERDPVPYGDVHIVFSKNVVGLPWNPGTRLPWASW